MKKIMSSVLLCSLVGFNVYAMASPLESWVSLSLINGHLPNSGLDFTELPG